MLNIKALKFGQISKLKGVPMVNAKGVKNITKAGSIGIGITKSDATATAGYVPPPRVVVIPEKRVDWKSTWTKIKKGVEENLPTVQTEVSPSPNMIWMIGGGLVALVLLKKAKLI